MSLLSCLPDKYRRSRRRKRSGAESRKVEFIQRAIHVFHCSANLSNPQDGVTGLPREWEIVSKALNDGNKTEKERRALFKKMKKFPEKVRTGKEMVIFKGGGKTDLGRQELVALLLSSCEGGHPEDRYEIIEKIGRGTYGDVYLARDKDTKGEVALKQCSPMYSETALSLYTNEIVVLHFFDHPNIIRAFASYYATPLEAEENAIYSDMKVPFLAMELMDCSLGELLDHVYEDDALGENVIAYVLREILNGVKYLHVKGIFHRDLKSDNILLSIDGKVKVADFGLSARFSYPEEGFCGITGTTLWMAPEICRLDKKLLSAEDTEGKIPLYTVKADIWSLGIVLIELLDGEPPFMDLWRANEKLQIKKTIINGPACRPQREVSPGMASILQAMLCKNPAKRPGCEEILEHKIFRSASPREEFALFVQAMFVIPG